MDINTLIFVMIAFILGIVFCDPYRPQVIDRYEVHHYHAQKDQAWQDLGPLANLSLEQIEAQVRPHVKNESTY